MVQDLHPGDWITGPFWNAAVKVVACQSRTGYDLVTVTADDGQATRAYVFTPADKERLTRTARSDFKGLTFDGRPEALLTKMEQMRKDLGDKVFDVVGQVLWSDDDLPGILERIALGEQQAVDDARAVIERAGEQASAAGQTSRGSARRPRRAAGRGRLPPQASDLRRAPAQSRGSGGVLPPGRALCRGQIADGAGMGGGAALGRSTLALHCTVRRQGDVDDSESPCQAGASRDQATADEDR